MEVFRESVPFLFGMLVSPLFLLLFRLKRSSQMTFSIMLASALVLGACVSAMMGELVGEISESVMAIIIDGSLVYTGAQVAYWLLWHPLLQARLHQENVVVPQEEYS